MSGVGKTHVGVVRTNNEDNYLVKNEKIGILNNLYIVADGMGGHNAGEVASKKCINYFCKYVEDSKDTDIETVIVEGIKFANTKVYNKSIIEPSYMGMGTTVSVCTLIDGRIKIGHVGDSRIYKINESGIIQLTIDHSYVYEMLQSGKITKEEAENHPNKNLVTRALGVGPDVKVDYYDFYLEENDKILICSDGLSTMVDDETIREIVMLGLDIEKTVDKLICKAIEHGGEDNISIVLKDVGGEITCN